MYKNIFVVVLMICVLFSGCTNNTILTKYSESDVNKLETMYYDGIDYAYFGVQNTHTIENINFYSFFWHIKVCSLIDYKLPKKQINETFSSYLKMSNKNIENNDDLYDCFLKSELVKLLDYKLSKEKRDYYINYITNLKDKNGLFSQKNDLNRSNLAVTYFSLCVLKNLKYNIDSLIDTKESLFSYLKNDKLENTSETIIALKCAEIFNFSESERQFLIKKYTPFIKGNLKELNTTISQYDYQDYFYLPMVLDIISLADYMDVLGNDKKVVSEPLNLEDFLKKSEIQTVSIAIQINNKLNKINEISYLNIYMKNYLKNYLYYGNFTVNNQLNYYGLLCSYLLDFKYDRSKIANFARAQNVKDLEIKELYFYYKTTELLGFKNIESLDKNIKTQVERIVKQFQSKSDLKTIHSMEQLYYLSQLSNAYHLNITTLLNSEISKLSTENSELSNIIELYFFSCLKKEGYFSNNNLDILKQLEIYKCEDDTGYKYTEKDKQPNLQATYLAILITNSYNKTINTELQKGITQLLNSLHCATGGYYNSESETQIIPYSFYYGLEINEMII